jgi:hypothetical protein
MDRVEMNAVDGCVLVQLEEMRQVGGTGGMIACCVNDVLAYDPVWRRKN